MANIPACFTAGRLLAAIALLAGPTGAGLAQNQATLGKRPERPILHVDIKTRGGKEYPVLVASTPNGKQVKVFENAHGAVWSPQGDRFVYITKGSSRVGAELEAMNLKGERETLFVVASEQDWLAWRPVWSPDGKRIAVIVISLAKDKAPTYSVAVIDVHTKKQLARHALPEGPLRLDFHMSPPDNFRWSPDEHKLLVSWESAVVVVTETGRVVKLSNDHVVAEWAGRSDAVYYLETGRFTRRDQKGLGPFYFRKLDEAKPIELASEKDLSNCGIGQHPGLHYAQLRLSPANDRIALVAGAADGQSATLRIYDLKQGKTLALDKPAKTYQTADRICTLEWAPDAGSIAVLAVSKDYDEVTIKVLDLGTAKWKVVARVNLDLRRHGVAGLEFLGLAKNLSWTQ